MRDATTLPSDEKLKLNRKKMETQLTVQERLHQSKKIWAFMADIEESMGTLEETRAVYDTIINLRVASPQIILNYANLLERYEYFEDSFKVFERGINLFGYPHVLPIWKTYLYKFINRYKGTKLERCRDLFEQCLKDCPSEHAQDFYLLYARVEEQFGFARHAMRVYDRACNHLTGDAKKLMYHIYINRAADLFGITRTREIYEKAIKSLEEKYLADMCLSYITLELKLHEIDRCRSIYQYGAQFADPKKYEDYWNQWYEFEVNYGNEDTFKEMLRVRRSVDVQYTQVSFSKNFDTLLSNEKPSAETKKESLQQAPSAATENNARAIDDMAMLEQNALKEHKDKNEIDIVMDEFDTNKPQNIDQNNTDSNEITLDNEADEHMELEVKQIPLTVFFRFGHLLIKSLFYFILFALLIASNKTKSKYVRNVAKMNRYRVFHHYEICFPIKSTAHINLHQHYSKSLFLKNLTRYVCISVT
ncbi:hypothetical protein RFI_17353 [Reticulomyxa filosa]|uniref:Pre-mRNA-splicing factor Syf1/CRNKL1-like C-terminal HAT-repeats domain-containing protein n=1 Tax=Reticulomyxa filosa TaxID=46433 RepID=X6N0V3_RETFI|nr:hypothetical protein RFI_17353 [Reticulomyxa filosa]|eukprot:ETO19875.1 hypothetical protein RFI_17353 [Reticulomyxa filosa]